MVSHPVSKASLAYYCMLASFASARSTLQCAASYAETDFRTDIPNITVPTLLIHGDDDKIVPREVSSDKTAAMIPGSQYLVYDGAPHGLFYTHRDKLNKDIINFLSGATGAYSTSLTQVSENQF